MASRLVHFWEAGQSQFVSTVSSGGGASQVMLEAANLTETASLQTGRDYLFVCTGLFGNRGGLVGNGGAAAEVGLQIGVNGWTNYLARQHWYDATWRVTARAQQFLFLHRVQNYQAGTTLRIVARINDLLNAGNIQGRFSVDNVRILAFDLTQLSTNGIPFAWGEAINYAGAAIPYLPGPAAVFHFADVAANFVGADGELLAFHTVAAVTPTAPVPFQSALRLADAAGATVLDTAFNWRDTTPGMAVNAQMTWFDPRLQAILHQGGMSVIPVATPANAHKLQLAGLTIVNSSLGTPYAQVHRAAIFAVPMRAFDQDVAFTHRVDDFARAFGDTQVVSGGYLGGDQVVDWTADIGPYRALVVNDEVSAQEPGYMVLVSGAMDSLLTSTHSARFAVRRNGQVTPQAPTLGLFQTCLQQQLPLGLDTAPPLFLPTWHNPLGVNEFGVQGFRNPAEPRGVQMTRGRYISTVAFYTFDQAPAPASRPQAGPEIDVVLEREALALGSLVTPPVVPSFVQNGELVGADSEEMESEDGHRTVWPRLLGVRQRSQLIFGPITEANLASLLSFFSTQQRAAFKVRLEGEDTERAFAIVGGHPRQRRLSSAPLQGTGLSTWELTIEAIELLWLGGS